MSLNQISKPQILTWLTRTWEPFSFIFSFKVKSSGNNPKRTAEEVSTASVQNIYKRLATYYVRLVHVEKSFILNSNSNCIIELCISLERTDDNLYTSRLGQKIKKLQAWSYRAKREQRHWKQDYSSVRLFRKRQATVFIAKIFFQ